MKSPESKVAFIFPGQGLVPRDIITYHQILEERDPLKTRERLNLAQQAINKELGSGSFDLEIELNNPDSPAFEMTSFMQPVVYTFSRLASEIAKDGIDPDKVAGHSLGEYAALTEANVLSFEQAIELVAFRGRVHQQACEEKPSALIGIFDIADNLDLAEERVSNLCLQSGAEIALINAPNFIVVGAAKDEIGDVESLAKEAGAKRTIVLKTAGAFHAARFMQGAADRLGERLDDYSLSDPKIPVVTNLTGDESSSSAEIRNYLEESMVNPVLWAQSIQYMVDSGVTRFIEVGPGKSLKSLNRMIDPNLDLQTTNILDLTS